MTTTEELIVIGRAAREAARRHLLARDPELAEAARAESAARIAELEAEAARLADENAALRADAARRAPRGRKPT